MLQLERPIEDFLASLLCDQLFVRFPNLRVASVENGAGFLPGLLKRLDVLHHKLAGWFPEHPVETFKRHIWINPFWEDDLGELLELMGHERMIFGSDWPHIEGMPRPLDYLEELAGRPDDVRNALEENGVRVLSGRCELARFPNGLRVRVCGTEAPWGSPLGAPLEREGADLVVVLSHTPDNVYDLGRLGADVVFSGHTHGGQIRLPGVGALVVPSRYGRRFDEGHFVVDGTHLVVSAGVGADAPALRVWCPPEVVLVDFVGDDAAARGPS